MGEQDGKGMWDDFARMLKGYWDRLTHNVTSLFTRGAKKGAGKVGQTIRDKVKERDGRIAFDAVLNDGKHGEVRSSGYYNFEQINEIVHQAKMANIQICLDQVTPGVEQVKMSKKDMDELTALHRRDQELSQKISQLANRVSGKQTESKALARLQAEQDEVKNQIKAKNAKGCLYSFYVNIQHEGFAQKMEEAYLPNEIDQLQSIIDDRTAIGKERFVHLNVSTNKLTIEDIKSLDDVVCNYGNAVSQEFLSVPHMEAEVSKQTYVNMLKTKELDLRHAALLEPGNERIKILCSKEDMGGMVATIDACKDDSDRFVAVSVDPSMGEGKDGWDSASGMSEFYIPYSAETFNKLSDMEANRPDLFMQTRIIYKEENPKPTIQFRTNITENEIYTEFKDELKKNELDVAMEEENKRLASLQQNNYKDIDYEAMQTAMDQQKNGNGQNPKKPKQDEKPKVEKKNPNDSNRKPFFGQNKGRVKKKKSKSHDKGGR